MTRTFDDGRHGTVVEASAGDLEWLREFLHPAYAAREEAPQKRNAPRAVLEEVGALEALAVSDARRAAFVMDSGPLRLPEARGRAGTWHVGAMPGVHLRLDAEGLQASVVFETAARPAARIVLMRVVREHTHNHAIAAGDVVLHAAAVVHAGRALAVAGPKGAGKTTLLLHLLSAQGTGYLSNDRISVNPRGTARAVPTIVAVRPGTQALMPGAAARLAGAGDFLRRRDDRAGAASPVSSGGVWYLSPAQLAASVGCPMNAEAPLAAVAVLAAVGGPTTTVSRLSQEEARRVLVSTLIGHRSGTYVSDLFSPPSSVIGRDDLASRCARLAGHVPVYSVRMSAMPGLHEAARILEACTG